MWLVRKSSCLADADRCSSGKILQDQNTVESYSIEEKGFIVCMVSKVTTSATHLSTAMLTLKRSPRLPRLVQLLRLPRPHESPPHQPKELHKRPPLLPLRRRCPVSRPAMPPPPLHQLVPPLPLRRREAAPSMIPQHLSSETREPPSSQTWRAWAFPGRRSTRPCGQRSTTPTAP